MKVAVVGGGISGLATAFFLTQRNEHEVTVYEKENCLGGKIRGSEVGGLLVEEGPDAFVTRSPEIFEIIEALGVEDQLIHPLANRALIYRKKALHYLPAGLTLGFPATKEHIFTNKVLTPAERMITYAKWRLANARNQSVDGDDLGNILEHYISRSYTNNVLDPLIGGINAASIHGASAEITAPQILNLLKGLQPVTHMGRPEMQLPPFASFKHGLDFLIRSLNQYLESKGTLVLKDTPVIGLRSTDTGVQVAAHESLESFDKVVLATPSRSAGDLIQSISPESAALLNSIRRASIIMTTVLASGDLSHIDSQVSGVLVPRTEPYFTTAITIGPNKWPTWRSDEGVVLRISSGRLEERAHLALEPETLVHLLMGEVQEVLGSDIKVVDYRVSSWKESFVRFSPYHRQLILKVQNKLAQESDSKIELAGSYLLGSGIPTCVRTAKLAAIKVSGQTI